MDPKTTKKINVFFACVQYREIEVIEAPVCLPKHRDSNMSCCILKK